VPTRTRHVLAGAAIAFVALSFAYGVGWPDVSRLALTQAVAYDGSLRIDRFAAQTQDRAEFGGHTYSDKAPGASFLALPSLEVARLLRAVGSQERALGAWHDRWLLWALRVLTSGLGYLAAVALAFLAARRLAPETAPVVAADGRTRDDGATDGRDRLRPPPRCGPRLRSLPAGLARGRPRLRGCRRERWWAGALRVAAFMLVALVAAGAALLLRPDLAALRRAARSDQ
jgi:hypothetical protein